VADKTGQVNCAPPKQAQILVLAAPPETPANRLRELPGEEQPGPGSAPGDTDQGAQTAPGAGPETPAEKSPGPSFCGHAGFQRYWRQWLGVVEAFAQGGTPQVDEESFSALRSTLLEQCWVHPRTGTEVSAEVLKHLEAIVEPWVTPRALAQMDGATLTSLWVRCRQLDREMGNRERVPLGRLLGLLALLGVVGALGWLISRVQKWPAFLKPAAHWVRATVAAQPVLYLAVTIPVVVLVVIFVLARLLRS
jgi:hypothetical protein